MKITNLIFLTTIAVCSPYHWVLAQGMENEHVSERAQFSVEENITRLKLVDKEHSVLIEIGTRKSIETDAIADQPKFSGISISKITVTVDGKIILVPRSSVDYLVDVNRCSIEHGNKGWELSIDGRDGSYGYTAVIYFDRNQVHRRAIFADAKRTRLLEEIRYMPPDIID